MPRKTKEQRKKNRQKQRELDALAAEKRAAKAEAHQKRQQEQQAVKEEKQARKEAKKTYLALQRTEKLCVRKLYETEEQKFSAFRFEEWHQGVEKWCTASLGRLIAPNDLSESELDRFRAFVCYYLAFRSQDYGDGDPFIYKYCDVQNLQGCHNKIKTYAQEAQYFLEKRHVLSETDAKRLETLMGPLVRVEKLIAFWQRGTLYLDRKAFKIPASLEIATELCELLTKVWRELTRQGYELMTALENGDNKTLETLCEQKYTADDRLDRCYANMSYAIGKGDALLLLHYLNFDTATLNAAASARLDSYIQLYESGDVGDYQAHQVIDSGVPRCPNGNPSIVVGTTHMSGEIGPEKMSTKVWDDIAQHTTDKAKILEYLRRERARYDLARDVKKDPDAWLANRAARFVESTRILKARGYSL